MTMSTVPKGTVSGKTWTYTIQQGLKFEDGSPITSKDVAYGVARTFDRAELKLAAGNLQTLVGLGVWSQCNTVVTRAGSHRDQVGFQHVAVDHQTWSLKVRNQRCQGHHDIVPDLEPASSTVR